MSRWALRGRAQRFEHDPARRSDTPTLVDLALRATLLGTPSGRHEVLDTLAQVDRSAIQDVLEPLKLSDPTATFVMELLDTNRRRLLDER